MKIEFTCLDAYIHHQQIPSSDTWVYAYTNGTRTIEAHRQEVCIALKKECELYDSFPVWNKKIITECFHGALPRINEVVLLPIIGTDASFDCQTVQHEGAWYMIIDLLNVADNGETLKQVTFLLHHLCHYHLIHHMLDNIVWKTSQKLSYVGQLQYRFLLEGCSWYFAWNENHEQYVFQNTQYQARKERAFALYHQALQVEDKDTQTTILKGLQTASFWNCFPDVAGMFYLDDLAQKQGATALVEFLTQIDLAAYEEAS